MAGKADSLCAVGTRLAEIGLKAISYASVSAIDGQQLIDRAIESGFKRAYRAMRRATGILRQMLRASK